MTRPGRRVCSGVRKGVSDDGNDALCLTLTRLCQLPRLLFLKVPVGLSEKPKDRLHPESKLAFVIVTGNLICLHGIREQVCRHRHVPVHRAGR